jgi:hypothetical protein
MNGSHGLHRPGIGTLPLIHEHAHFPDAHQRHDH